MSWVNQYCRVQRSLHRIQNLNKIQDSNEEEYEDLLWCYFQNCWHLKDWLKNDPSISQTQVDEIKRLVDRGESNSVALMVCSDIANATKHFTLTHRPPRVNAEANNKVFNMHVYNGKQPEKPEPDTWDVLISYDGDQHTERREALEIARQALEDWNRIITGIGLALPT
jgi:hypothetical protein